jgi:Secretion system C-terminal sorting domain
MKKLFSILILFCLFATSVDAQIRNVIVEKYYISDTLDATDTIDGPSRSLPAGSITYRVFVQIDSGYKIHKIYGTPCHPMKITSTANFYNNINRPDEYFGYLIKKQYFGSNPLLALDSWLTLGLCAKTNTTKYMAVLKSDDTDGSLIGGTQYGGGTAGIAGGLVANNDTAAHIPVDTADGMVVASGNYNNWIDFGFNRSGQPVTGRDTTVFGDSLVGSQFYSTTAYLQENEGVRGDSATGHKVLVAQLTTKGTINFEINLELMDSTGGPNNGHLLNYVASAGNCGVPTGDTTVLGLLKYPPDVPVCGCGDPFYVEYNPNAPCFNDSAYCLHRIVYGCMDTLACNYDPKANYNIQTLCCYPGKCNDRDISLVCPGISSDYAFNLFPNPANSLLTLQLSAGNNNDVKYIIYDSYGVNVMERDLGTLSGSVSQQVDVSNMQAGLYLVRVYVGSSTMSKTFMKD